MKTKHCLCTAFAALSLVAVANERVKEAIELVMTNSCMAIRIVASQAEEWELPQQLHAESSFTNLVAVVRSELNNCSQSFAGGMTNNLRRKVFEEALAECGPDTYRNALVRWFGGALPSGVSPDVVDHFASPVCPSMYGYFIRHYDDPGVSNVWLNIKSLYLASSNTVNAAGIDEILSGEARRYFDDMDEIERSLRER